ncbi:hypothetical protein MHBO_001712 [Bonamia ostreae]|uniref:Inositol polyphosphate-related phosphatase domain-containing protein n=1 Tax=Bonamia ostreae TaxID=126728 RepID=A0ABV2AJX9_9EUKA
MENIERYLQSTPEILIFYVAILVYILILLSTCAYYQCKIGNCGTRRKRGDFDFKNLRVQVLTLNCEGNAPPTNLDDFFYDPFNSDIICVMLQEMVPLKKADTIKRSFIIDDKTALNKWDVAMKNFLVYDKSGFRLIARRSEVGNAVLVYANHKTSKHISSIQTRSIKLGYAKNTLGNKSSTAASFYLGNDILCFSSAHLNSHRFKNDKRYKDIQRMFKKIKFNFNGKTMTIDKMNTFCGGDYNFRTPVKEHINDEQYPKLSELKEQCQANDFSLAVSLDKNYNQITETMQGNFVEADIKFPPTFHLDFSDPREYVDIVKKGKHLTPSYTDRIFTNLTSEGIKVYTSPSLRYSDHNPVIFVYQFPDEKPKRN